MTMPATPSAEQALYRGHVMHRRLRPFVHRFDYRVFSLYLDIDRIAQTCAGLRWLSHNRANLLSIYDRDHGPRDGGDLRTWVDAQMRQAGMDRPHRVMLLCFPRVMGYVFNPLSAYYCFDADDRMTAVIHEVRNTFGDMHHYVLPVTAAAADGPIAQATDKRFYVSPFIGMTARYRFRLTRPGRRLSILIRLHTPAGETLIATQTGQRRALSDGEILRALARKPLMTWKVIAAIHWQALRLWIKGAKFHSRNTAPKGHTTVDAPTPPSSTKPGSVV